jgi:hypothetical protein
VPRRLNSSEEAQAWTNMRVKEITEDPRIAAMKAEEKEKARWKALTFKEKLKEIFCFPKIER